MEKIIEHEGKKYRVVDDDISICMACCFFDDDIHWNWVMCRDHEKKGFPPCYINNCHFELVEETNQKE